MTYHDTWQLDTLFAGGVTGRPFQDKVKSLKIKQADITEQINTFSLVNAEKSDQLFQLISAMAALEKEITQVNTFANMAADSDMTDEAAAVARNQVQMLQQPYQLADAQFNKKIAELNNEEWQQLLKSDPRLEEIAFILNERRESAQRLMGDEAEALLNHLNSDGIKAWSQIYATTSAVLKIKVKLSDGEHEYSVGQAMNRMYADPIADNRAKIFQAWEAAFSQYGPIFADILNHLAGYRLTMQQAHNYQDYLEEPLEYNRMQPQTLTAMWQAVSAGKIDLLKFLKRKQELLGLQQLNWQDVEAPLTFADEETELYTFSEATEFIIKHFASFGPQLADFSQHALKNAWVEAEDRPNKRPGGYCAELPVSKESRIFMTFTGTASDVSTLAHELGHAFHSDVLKHQPRWNQAYAMNVAETASTFAEMIISNANLMSATNTRQRLQLLNAKLENAVAMFLNIPARFLFEKAFYEERQVTFVSESKLNELMTTAQKEAFGDVLSEYHPHFWASKLHFFIDDVPFYNFPYTFGYLFSLGIYAAYLKAPEGFEEKYIALLQDTGKMSVEDLALKHLKIDLTQIDFWQAGVALIAEDARAFITDSADMVG